MMGQYKAFKPEDKLIYKIAELKNSSKSKKRQSKSKQTGYSDSNQY